MPAVELFSIGHSNTTVGRLIERLQQHGIATICDVRSAPYSRFAPQFNREHIADELRHAGFAYHFMGDTLGGKPADAALRTADGAFPDYDKIIASVAFQRNIDALIALGARSPTAFMCGEADYHGCHRHRLITPALLARDVGVWHILADGSCDAGAIEPQQIRMF